MRILIQGMVTLRSALPLLAALALAACASTPPAASMTLSPVPCGGDPDHGCAGEVDDSEAYGTAYAYYPPLMPVYPIVGLPPAAPPMKPPPPPPPTIRVHPPLERPCPKGNKLCP